MNIQPVTIIFSLWIAELTYNFFFINEERLLISNNKLGHMAQQCFE